MNSWNPLTTQLYVHLQIYASAKRLAFLLRK